MTEIDPQTEVVVKQDCESPGAATMFSIGKGYESYEEIEKYLEERFEYSPGTYTIFTPENSCKIGPVPIHQGLSEEQKAELETLKSNLSENNGVDVVFPSKTDSSISETIMKDGASYYAQVDDYDFTLIIKEDNELNIDVEDRFEDIISEVEEIEDSYLFLGGKRTDLSNMPRARGENYKVVRLVFRMLRDNSVIHELRNAMEEYSGHHEIILNLGNLKDRIKTIGAREGVTFQDLREDTFVTVRLEDKAVEIDGFPYDADDTEPILDLEDIEEELELLEKHLPSESILGIIETMGNDMEEIYPEICIRE